MKNFLLRACRGAFLGVDLSRGISFQPWDLVKQSRACIKNSFSIYFPLNTSLLYFQKLQELLWLIDYTSKEKKMISALNRELTSTWAINIFYRRWSIQAVASLKNEQSSVIPNGYNFFFNLNAFKISFFSQ